ncbi:HAD family phosphatase [Halosquirtibacter xylanolyticus]|uniref:HAD family hydrolase n=1 Tax=Halosquirtibacter xylanolyticus TaxID=3374599 RepID=UPI00374882D5|nr:HAD family phosphatase [Prolixibacteraceae bacterium]
MKKISAVLFDMDGVLLDTMPLHEAAWSQLFNEENIPFDAEDAYLNEGRTGISMIETVYHKTKGSTPSKEYTHKLYERKKEIMKRFPPVVEIIGMPKVLEFLYSKGIKIGVVTGSGQRNIINKLQQFYDKIVIEENIITGLDVKNGKPHPEPYVKALDRVDITAEEAIVIENAPLGVEAAKAANIFTIAINTGILDDKVLEEAGANRVCKDSEELLQMLRDYIH